MEETGTIDHDTMYKLFDDASQAELAKISKEFTFDVKDAGHEEAAVVDPTIPKDEVALGEGKDAPSRA